MGKYEKYVVLLGALLINCHLSVSLNFGNYSTYILSLYYIRHPSGSFDIDPSWMLPIYLLTSNLATMLVDVIKKGIGLRFTMCLGITMFSLGLCVSYFTVSQSIWATTLTFMAIGGFGKGVASTCGMIYVASWFSSNMGLATGMHKAASATGAIATNLLLTAYINPENLSPDTTHGELHLFSQEEVLERVPNSFLIIGAVSTVMQFTGLLLLRMPETMLPDKETSHLLQNSQTDKTKDHIQSSDLSTPPNGRANSQLNGGRTEHPQMSKASKSDMPDHQSLTKQTEINFTAKQVLQSETFYVLELAVVSLAMGMIIVGTFSKLFGQVWIKDDRFLAFVSSSASFGNVVFSLAGGSLVDLIGLKNTMIVHLATSSLFLSLWYFTVRVSQWLYLFWTIILYSTHFNQTLLFTISALQIFGQRHFATNLGLMQIASLIFYLLSPPLIAFSLSSLGWFWLFFIGGCISFCALVFVTLRMPRN